METKTFMCFKCEEEFPIQKCRLHSHPQHFKYQKKMENVVFEFCPRCFNFLKNEEKKRQLKLFK
jgi:hypothetical protein